MGLKKLTAKDEGVAKRFIIRNQTQSRRQVAAAVIRLFEIRPVEFLTGNSFENLCGRAGCRDGRNAGRDGRLANRACHDEYPDVRYEQPGNSRVEGRAAVDAGREQCRADHRAYRAGQRGDQFGHAAGPAGRWTGPNPGQRQILILRNTAKQ